MKSNYVLAMLLMLPLAAATRSATAAEFMFRALIDGQMIEGKPLSWNSERMELLGRDGRLHEFNPKDAKEAVKTSPTFVPYSADELKAMLQQEYDNRFEVSITRHYVVVHPSGQRDVWANRFEDLYNRFEHYFLVRGFELQEPRYPLVAVVFRNQDEYFRSAAATGTPMHPNTLGHYDPISNRIFLFDVTGGKAKRDWSENATTIIHEATHQMAFNTGIHRRFAAEPFWLVEGLATMFEAPGVWNPENDHSQSDRVNRGRLNGFRKFVKDHPQPGSLATLLTSDDAFRNDPNDAYAEAWALSFYLCETRPRQYCAYLAKTAERPPFSFYEPAERMADFQAIFGGDLKLFDANFLSYMRDVK
ncbi:MAG TPA: DUF1570 domain-containing protein [Lacipirellulaceae bacterium]|nr:DUF1570 domain-containing protein [Lacipirellulaceae bacterium]